MLTLKEVAQRLNVHENTVKNFIRGGKLTGYKLNRVWRRRTWKNFLIKGSGEKMRNLVGTDLSLSLRRNYE
jgi:excisionase family DNA binding protein